MNRCNHQIAVAELDRHQFIVRRDGHMAACDFARRVIRQYRSALSERNQRGFRCGYGLAYRRELVVSCATLRGILRIPA